MAIAFDAATNNDAFGATSLTWTFNHAVTGSSPSLFLGFSTFAATDIVTAVTYNGVAMTRSQAIIGGGPYGSLYGYVLPNCATGTNAVLVVTSGLTNFTGTAASYTGTDTTTQPDGSAQSSLAGAPGVVDTPVTITTTVSGDWAGLFVACGRQVNAGTGSVRRTLSSNTQSGWLDTNGAFGSTGSNFINYQTNASGGGPLQAIALGISAPNAASTAKPLTMLGVG